MLTRCGPPGALPAIFLFLMVLIPGAAALSDGPVPSDVLADALEVSRRGESPLFAVGNLALHEVSYASLPALLSFSLEGERTRAIVVSFDAREGDPDGLRRDADRVLKRLRVRYGPPASVTRTAGEFKTHVWREGPRILVHTVVFTPGLERHYIEANMGTRDE